VSSAAQSAVRNEIACYEPVDDAKIIKEQDQIKDDLTEELKNACEEQEFPVVMAAMANTFGYHIIQNIQPKNYSNVIKAFSQCLTHVVAPLMASEEDRHHWEKVEPSNEPSNRLN
jgi:glutamate-1-semialdehyde aminotransferase